MTLSTANSRQSLHKPPRVMDALSDIPGGEENLLPLAAIQAPLRVDFDMWPFSQPSPDTPERVRLFWDGSEVAEKSWTASIDPNDLYVTVPLHVLDEGRHVLYYDLLIYNGVESPSGSLFITIDKTRPVLASSDERLIFAAEVIANGVTDYYLQTHNDEVLAELPAYDAVKPGDTLTWFWDRTPFDRDQAGSRDLVLADTGKPLLIAFGGEMIRARGDGPRYVYYQVRDRAGNDSPDARPVTLTIAATPAPRDLPWPVVEPATGAGERVTLEPEKTDSGVWVVVPDQATVQPDEVIWVQWAQVGQLGSYRTSKPQPVDSRRYLIPKEHVAPHIGKQLPVSYEVIGPTGTFPSDTRQLQVLPLNLRYLPVIQCQNLSGGNLSLASIPGTGARLTLGTWTLIATTQRVRINVSGVSSSTGAPLELKVVDSHAITNNEVIVGIGAASNIVVPKNFMSQLRLGTPFSIKVYVSFDEGQTWPVPAVPNFPRNDSITLIA